MNVMTVNNNTQLQLPFTACLYVKLYVKIVSELFLFNPPHHSIEAEFLKIPILLIF